MTDKRLEEEATVAAIAEMAFFIEFLRDFETEAAARAVSAFCAGSPELVVRFIENQTLLLHNFRAEVRSDVVARLETVTGRMREENTKCH